MATVLANAERAQIDPRKLRDYVLNPGHLVGRYKAAYFLAMGYSASDWARLESDIREQHLTQTAVEGKPSPHGRKYAITAALAGPNGVSRQVTTVWIFREGNDYAELVTIEPAPRVE